MTGRSGRGPFPALSRFVHARVDGWRSGTEQSQSFVLAVLLVGIAISFAVSSQRYDWFPLTGYFLWLLLGMLLLRFRQLIVLSTMTTLAAVTAMVLSGPITVIRISAIVMLGLAVLLILYQSSRQRSGLPTPLSEALLADLRDRLEAQGMIPPLPAGWQSQSAMLAAHGVGYAGDFMVADLSEDDRLQLILVDVCGKGLTAGPQALQLAGALGGLLGVVSSEQLFEGANRFLLRQRADETFATAVHVVIDLSSGHYEIVSAGHPPALRWDTEQREWSIDNARGMALGIMAHPEFTASTGVLAPGDALMFYTDGVVESRVSDLDTGIAWLQKTARVAVAKGFDGAARRVLKQVAQGDDDRAVLILSRNRDD